MLFMLSVKRFATSAMELEALSGTASPMRDSAVLLGGVKEEACIDDMGELTLGNCGGEKQPVLVLSELPERKF